MGMVQILFNLQALRFMKMSVEGVRGVRGTYKKLTPYWNSYKKNIAFFFEVALD